MSRFVARFVLAYLGHLLCEAIKTKYVDVEVHFTGFQIGILREVARRKGVDLNELMDRMLRVALIRAEREERRDARMLLRYL